MKAFLKPLKPDSFSFLLSLMAGILAGSFFSNNKVLIFSIIFFLSVFLFFSFFFYKKKVFLVTLGFIFVFGYLSIQARVFPHLPSHHISNYLDLKKPVVTGKVVSFAKHYKNKQTITVLCQALRTKDISKKKVTGKINLNLYRLSQKTPQFGDTIEFESSIRPLRNFMNPGAFNYERYLKLRGIYGTAYTDMEKIKIFSPAGQTGLFSYLIRKIEKLRINYYSFVVNRHSKTGKIMAALITGKKEILSPDIRDLFSKAGISHLLAISGLHLSIVCLLFFYFFYRLLSLMPVLLISGKSKKISGILTLLPLTGYAVFTGFSPSTQRALIMIIVLMISLASEKEKDIFSSLSIAGILILMVDSTALFSISFQLSFIAVVFIVCGVSLLKKYSVFIKKNLFSKIGLMICVTFFASLGTSPLTAHYFNVVSAISIISNLLFIPVIGFLVLPLGLISLACFSCFPLVATGLIHGANTLISFSITCSKFFVSIPFSWSRTNTLQWYEIMIIYFIFIFIFLALKGHKKFSTLILILIFLLGLLAFSNTRLRKISQKNLTITIIDVGQGSSALIQTSEGKTILVDGGGFSDYSSFDTGRFIVAPFLWHKRIKSLDYVILSHPETDHLNGLVFILKNFKVKFLIKNTDIKNSASYARLIKACQTKHITIWNPSAPLNELDFGITRLLFYDSFNDILSYGFNNNSLVFKLIFKKFSMLFPGDILTRRENDLSCRNMMDLQSDILLSPHHGSATSSTKIFLDKVQPKSVIISCGWLNRYGFPHDTVLKRYKNKKIKIFRTDKDGAIFISSDGKTHDINTYKGGY